MAIVDRLIIALTTFTLPALAILNSSQKNSELSPAYSRPESPISYTSFRGTRVTKLPDPTFFTRDYIIFNN
jgi:hypothetical protein